MIQRLTIPISIHPDEHLPAAITRAAALNGRIQPSEILTQAGIPYVRAVGLPRQSLETAAAVAAVLGAHPQTVESGYHPKTPGGMINFFGTNIRFRHHSNERRYIAPATFADIGYIKALWQVRPLPFDIRTLERTISHCPVCEAPFGYAKTLGLWACENCAGRDDFGLPKPSVDVRDFPQQILSVDDREAFDLVVSFIDPDPLVRHKTQPVLHDELGGLSRGELFEFAVALCCVKDQDTERATSSLARPSIEADFVRVFTPDALALAGRTMMAWPKPFDELCEHARQDTAKRGHHGAKAELGQIYQLMRERTISEKSRAVFEVAVKRNMASGPARAMTRRYRADGDLRTSTELQSTFGISARTLDRLLADTRVESYSTTTDFGPKLFRLQQINEIVESKEMAEVAGSVGRRLGIPLDAVSDLADAGLIKREDGPAVHLLMRDATYYSRKSIDSLIARLESQVVEEVTTNTSSTRLTVAMARFDSPKKPWVEVINAILKRKLKVVIVKGRLDAILIKLAAESFDAILFALPEGCAEKYRASPGLTHAEVCKLLGVSWALVGVLMEAGELPSRGATRSQVEAVTQRLVFVSELAQRLDTKSLRHVRQYMQLLGVEPMFEGSSRGGLIYSRLEALAAIRNRHLIEEMTA